MASWGLLGFSLPAAALVLLVASCSSAECESYPRAAGPLSQAQTGYRTACVDTGLHYEGRRYFYAAAGLYASLGDEIEGVTSPACNDTGGNDPDTPVVAYRVDDYCASDVFAIVNKNDRVTVWVAG